MKFDLDDLNKKKTEDIITQFMNIPNKEVLLEFTGCFHPMNKFRTNRVAKALPYLPKHIRTVIFKGQYIFTHESESYTVSNGNGPYDFGKTETRYFDVRRIGDFVEEDIAALPKTVTSVSMSFSGESNVWDVRTNVPQDLLRILKKLPKYVTNLALINLQSTMSFFRFLQLIPNSVEYLHLEEISLSKISEKKLNRLKNRQWDLQHLILKKIKSGLGAPFQSLDFLKLFKLKSLSLGENNLDKFTVNKLEVLFSKLASLNLLGLLLDYNNLASFGYLVLSSLLKSLSAIPRLDLSHNGLMLLPFEELKEILEAHTGLTSLRLGETNTSALSIEDLTLRYTHCLPEHINALHFNGFKLLGRPVNPAQGTPPIDDLIYVISHLSNHIKVLDLSDNDFSSEELILIFKNLPPHLQKVKLNRHVFSLDKTVIKEIFSHFPKNLELEIHENGINALPFTKMNDLLDALPDTTIDFGKTRLNVQANGGALFNSPYLSQKKIRHQNEFSQMMIALVPLFMAKKIDFKVFYVLLPCLFGSNAKVTNNQVKEIRLRGTYLFAESKPTEIECHNSIKARFVLTENETKLDLSHCALNTLNSEALKKVFKSIPPGVTSLNLSHNGFLNTEFTKSNFMNALSALPESITHLNLIGNGLEHLNEKELAKVLVNLPRSVQFITFANERPIHPKDQIKRRKIPSHYQDLTKKTSGMETPKVLLNDYTKGDSRFKRIITFHWDRGHVAEVNTIAQRIAKNQLKNEMDVRAEIEEILEKNQAGCLGKTWMHLFNHSKHKEYKEEPNDILKDGIQLEAF